MAKLKNLQWYDDKKTAWKLSIVNEGCSKWHDIGVLVGVPTGILEGMRKQHNIAECFTEVLQYWIQTGGNPSYPATWIGLQNVLADSELGVLAAKIKAAIPYISEA